MLNELVGNQRFLRVHHRVLNAQTTLRTLHERPVAPGYVDAAEGDVCWLVDGEDVHWFLHHPPPGNRLPSRAEILRRLDDGRFTRLETMLAEPLQGVPLVVELKAGRGDARRALTRLTSLLRERAPGLHYLDAFSSRLLRLVKDVSPDTPTSLHTRLGVYGRTVLKTAFEVPPVWPLSLARLDHVDIVTVTFRYSPSRWLSVPEGIERWHRHVFDAGKLLVFGGVESAETFRQLEATRAVGAYLKKAEMIDELAPRA